MGQGGQVRGDQGGLIDHTFLTEMIEGYAMKIPRRRFLHLAAGAVALLAASRIARALDYPTKPVRIIVGYPPGGALDIVARIIGQWLSEHLGQQFIIDNRPGASGNIGTEAVVRARADGYTLLVTNASSTINATLFEKLNYDFARDIAPIATIVRQPLVMLVNPSVPAQTVPEFIAYAKANPGKVIMASPGIGSSNHVASEMFRLMTGLDLLKVPYRGVGPAMIDLLSGQMQVMFATMASSIEYVKAGKLRALAVTTTARSDARSDIPPLTDFVPGYESSDWYGVAAPKSTPPEIIDKLSKEINAALADPAMRAQLIDQGGTLFRTSPAEFAKFIADDTEKWGKVIRAANIKAQ
jgi:tripartite-type tricarboxylate transporter receptor subunit TctC